MGSGLGRYDQNVCGRLDEIFAWCEDREILISLNIWFHNYISETVWSASWQVNPYKKVCDSKDFFSSEEAWKYQEKLYRYFIARWGYSRSLALWFIVDEVNGTDGWVSGDSLGAANWGRKIHEYFKKNDPYNHPTTGTRSGGIKEWWQEGYEVFDIAGREIYEAQGFPINKKGKFDPLDIHPLTNSYRNYGQEIEKLWSGFEKPAIIAETGWDHTFYEPKMPGYLAQYHNALWVCLVRGTAMTPFWWAHHKFVDDNVITSQLSNFRKFTDQIPFSKLTHLAPVNAGISNGDAFVMISDQIIFGWAVNSSSDVAGERVRVNNLNEGKYKLRLYHTWRGDFIHEEEISCKGGSVSFDIPVLFIDRSHARYIGQDIAFIMEPIN